MSNNDIFSLFLVLLFVLTYFYLLYLRFRCNDIRDFYNHILDLCNEYDKKNINLIIKGQKQSAIIFCYDKLPSYDRLLFSIKQLKPENFIPKEVLKELLT